MKRGYFEIGIYQPKTETNVGTLWRSAMQLGASGIFTIGHRYRKQSSDTTKSDRHIPLRQFDTFDDFLKARPHGSFLIGVEQGGRPLKNYCHAERAIYLLGAEDNGLPRGVADRCNSVISLDSIGPNSYNVAVTGSIVMYHRVYLSQ